MRVETFTCDECGAQKKDANHWFMLDAGSSLVITLYAWDSEKTDRKYVKHLCGEQCLLSRVGRDAGRLPRERTRI